MKTLANVRSATVETPLSGAQVCPQCCVFMAYWHNASRPYCPCVRKSIRKFVRLVAATILDYGPRPQAL